MPSSRSLGKPEKRGTRQFDPPQNHPPSPPGSGSGSDTASPSPRWPGRGIGKKPRNQDGTPEQSTLPG
ncbi:MAG: hypothetical protein ACYCYP_08830 [Leptospirales bacterium]